MQNILDMYSENKPQNMEGTYNQDVNNAGIAGLQGNVATSQNAVTQEQANLSAIQARLQGISGAGVNQQLQLEKGGGMGGGGTTNFLSAEQNKVAREAAIAAIPLQAEALASQARIQSLQGNAQAAQTLLTQAQDRVDKLFQIQSADAQNQYNYQNKLIDSVYDYATKQEQAKLDEKKLQNEQDFQLKRDEIQHQYDINLKNTGLSGGGTGGGGGTVPSTYTPGVDATVDSWAERIQSGQNKITDIPASQATLRNQVAVALNAMGNSPEGKPTTTELGKAALSNAEELLRKFDNREGTQVVGSSRLWSGGALQALIPGTKSYNFVNDFNAIKSQLSLDAVKYLKGQGQVSDAERALLAQAVTKLSLKQSESEFKKTLQGVIDKLKGGSQTQVIPKGTDGTNYGFPGYVSDGNQWVKK